ISNDLVLPFILRSQASGRTRPSENMEQLILKIRRTAIVLLLFFGYAYFRSADNTQALASIGLVSFAAIVQLAPAFFGGLFWQGANGRGAIAGMVCGFAVWGYTLLMPTLLSPEHWLVTQGLHPSGVLRPEALLGVEISPVANGVIWSLSINALAFVIGSLSRLPSASESAQASIFVDRNQPLAIGRRGAAAKVNVGELIATVARYLGTRRTQRSFESYWAEAGERPKDSDPVDQRLLRFSEQLLASAIGASSSRLVHTLLLQRFEATTPASIKLLDQASEALKYNRDILQSALDQMDQAISVFDADFRLAFWNRRFRRLLGLPASVGQVGTPLNEVMRQIADIHKLSEQGIDDGDLADKIVNQNEPWLLALAASERIVEIGTSPMPGGGVVVTWHDITERILVAEALREANETLERRVEERTSELVEANRELARATRAADDANAGKTRFLAAAGHDILQPLNAAKLYASTLEERLEETDNSTLTGNIIKSLESVENILGAILAISRLDTGRQETKVSTFPIEAIMEQMAVEFAPFARERGLELKFVHSTAWIRSDPALLRRLLQNLISNAIKYTPRNAPSGRILVGCRPRDAKVVIEVLDTGIGIADSDRQSIFTEFSRLDEGMRQAPGLGLGLSIVERIAKVLDIDVIMSSTPGKGTRFSVAVERAKPETASALARTREPVSRAASKLNDLFVLCIDNDLSILEGMSGLLTQWGCEVRTAHDLASAFATIEEAGKPPQIVLADYHLEKSNGIEAIHALRQSFGVELPCVLVTADRTPSLRSEAEAEGIKLIYKPVKPAALRAVLAMGHSRREAAE
ncbi:MAG: PAS-domain containing protein, partial [Nitratireductor sp.]|nr:PAS-domain containing protein [Nitratireductor sp.]